MKYQKFFYFLQNVGRDPSALVYEDELTGLYNRRYLLQYFKKRVSWDALEDSPLCLLMVDADYLKRINDQYGHNAGDSAIIKIAETIRKAVPANAVPVRYAGDNFLVLLPGRSREDSGQVAEKILRLIRSTGFRPQEAGTEVPLTVSIGLASAPADAADEKTLIHSADSAMYQAKHFGRNRWADVKDLPGRQIFPQTVLRHMDAAGIAGRKSQLEQVSTCLQKVAEGQSSFIIAQGAPGMGKTSFLAAIQQNLEKTRLKPVRIQGEIQEAFRPYYLASYAAMAILGRLPDKGLSILESMEEDEILKLSHVIPQLRGTSPQIPENDPAHREAVFASFTRFMARLAGKGPLVLLIDDFHYCDPASLHLFRMLMKAEDLLVFICATASSEKHTSGESVALDLFRSAHSEELEIQTIELTPLGEQDIERFLGMIFGGISLPKGICREMAGVTRGNPLFLVEIIRKMINDGKIYCRGTKWHVSPPEENYFPRSLDEIVKARMDCLDRESRKFLDRASALGESAFLSMLAGISRDRGARIYDIINNAEEQGIVRAEFEENDENIRFSSKRVRDIIYDGISGEEKRLLHRQIGAYQEKLYQQNLLPSASFLAHHFTRSEDKNKAGTYAKYQETLNSRIFDETEIDLYTGGETEPAKHKTRAETETSAQGLGDDRLSRQSMELVPYLLRSLLVSARNTRLYPQESKSVTSACREVIKLLEKIFENDPRVSVTAEGGRLWINGEKTEAAGLHWIEGKVLELLDGMEIKSLIFKKGVQENELRRVLDELARGRGKTVPPYHWKEFASRAGLSGIEIRQVAYTKTRQEDGEKQSQRQQEKPGKQPEAEPQVPDDAPYEDEESIKKARKLISTILGTYGQMRLYPAGGPVAKRAVSRLAEKLREFLGQYGALTLARVDGSLLINGVRADPAGCEALFGGMVKMLADAGLNSLTFSGQVTEEDLEAFFGAFLLTPAERLNREFWRELAESRGFSGLFFDLSVYGVHRIHPLAADSGQKGAQEKQDESGADNEEKKTRQARQAALEGRDIAGLLRDLFLEGKTGRVSAILGSLREKYISSEPADRSGLLEKFGKILSPGGWQPPAAYIELSADTLLLPVLEAETGRQRTRRAADLLQEAAARLVLYGRYRPAARIYTAIGRHPEFADSAPLETWDRPQVFGRKLDPAVADALVSDLRSGDQARRQEACQLISTMGKGTAPLLIDIMKQEQDLKARRTAAEVLGQMDSRAAEVARQALMTESRAEEKVRILEVIDSVTTDLATELRHILTDAGKQVRLAALRLAERIDTEETDTLLAELASGDDPDLAAGAVSVLGRKNSPRTRQVLISIVSEKKDPEVLAEACRAMGRIGSTEFIQPLVKIVTPRKRLFWRRKYPGPVRVAAAYALCRIPGEHAAIILQALKRDPDEKVRQAASVLDARKKDPGN